MICITALVCKRMLAARRRSEREMPDVVMLAIGFFALSVGYAMACDQL